MPITVVLLCSICIASFAELKGRKTIPPMGVLLSCPGGVGCLKTTRPVCFTTRKPASGPGFTLINGKTGLTDISMSFSGNRAG
ncbi:hypothetical protein MBH78_21095 [Oceanimonas sp. NS1]|nr:hypothetical protein [Oceanimonas sp. NS1]